VAVGRLLGALEVAEPEVVIEQNEDCFLSARPGLWEEEKKTKGTHCKTPEIVDR